MSENSTEPSAASSPVVVPGVAINADCLSAMTPRFSLPLRWFARRFFRHFNFDADTVERLKELEKSGSVVYVMRYGSRLDYFLFNAIFIREGLKLSRFANGIRFFYYRSLFKALGLAWKRRREVFRETNPKFARAQFRASVEGSESSFLFLRTASLRTQLRTRRHAVKQGRSELDLLEEIVDATSGLGHTVHLVPLALFWRKGPRSQQGFLNLTYGSTTRPSDLAKLTAFFTTYRGLTVRVGDPIDLGEFAAERREEGAKRIARKVRRAVLTYLYREEKVVEGPTLRPRHRVQYSVISDPEVKTAITAWAEEHNATAERATFEAAKMFREIAANMNSTVLAVINYVVSAILKKMFVSIELIGIEKIAEYAKKHPLVIVPSHRSYFDFLILSSVFYVNHLVPPHVAARDNMGFGPFGYLFRRAGAFFLRQSFDDPLYRAVFRTYITHLIKQGFTQEFFIEGGRSRTGKTLAPRLGMLGWNVDAFLSTARRDLFFVPIAITYERLVEEGAIVSELKGGKKEGESMMGLVRARKFLRRRFGSVSVNFGEPISLADALGSRREEFAEDHSPEIALQKRKFVQGLGNRIVERINWAVVPNSTSVAACALLGERRRGYFREELVSRMQEIVDLLRLQDVRLTWALDRDEGTYQMAIGSLLRSDLIRSSVDVRGEILHYEPNRRTALDLYRNAIIHYLVAPSFLARLLLAGGHVADLRSQLAGWLDLFYFEFFTPRNDILAAHFDGFLDHFERFGWVEKQNEQLRVTEKGVGSLVFLAGQTRGFVEVYYAAASALLTMEGALTAKEIYAAAREQFARAEILGEVSGGDSISETTFKNAVARFRHLGLIEEVPLASGESRKEVSFQPGPQHGDLLAVRERLASALIAR